MPSVLGEGPGQPMLTGGRRGNVCSDLHALASKPSLFERLSREVLASSGLTRVLQMQQPLHAFPVIPEALARAGLWKMWAAKY